MFGFSRRRMKLGRLKVQLNDSVKGMNSPMRQPKRSGSSNSDSADPASGNQPDELEEQCAAAAPENRSSPVGGSENWTVLSISGDKLAPRFNHAATVIGNKMIVVGGESGNGLLDDVQVLNVDSFSWTTASSKLYLSPSSLPLKFPACKGHCLVSWGKKVLLIGGKTEPWSDKVSVWAFDTETECWSLMESKGDIPVARCGHTVVRGSSALILFGGEDSKRRKLNDLHMFDLKSLTWLPLHCTGTGPSARSNHTSALYDDKTIYVFGGASKSRTLNDLYSLDFETMIWSRIKARGFHPSPRAGCCSVLRGTKWYIVGGGSRKKRRGETLVFDILKAEWSVAGTSLPSSITTNKGFSLVFGQHNDKDFLVAFGGFKKDPSDQVEVLGMGTNGSSMSRRSFPGKVPGSSLLEKYSSSTGLTSQLGNGSSQHTVDSAARQNLAAVIEQHGSGRLSSSESSLFESNQAAGNVSLRKQFHNEEEYLKMAKVEDESSQPQASEHKMNHSDINSRSSTIGSKRSPDSVSTHEHSNPRLHSNDSGVPESDTKLGTATAPYTSSVSQFYESKITSLIRKNAMLEGQLAAAMVSREAAEKNLMTALKSKQESEKKTSDTMKSMELLKEKLAGVELAHEESNNLSNIVHSDNVRLEHDVAFLKAVLEDTQKELHSTRGVLAGERARAFQLQVEVFHLKQRLQSMENRAPTPRKPFNV